LFYLILEFSFDYDGLEINIYNYNKQENDNIYRE